MDEMIFLRFLTNILGLGACRLTDEALRVFEEECCFEKTLQPMYTAQSLAYVREHMASETLYEITDYLQTNLCFFRFEGREYLLGPYVKDRFSQRDMQELLASHKLPASVLLPLKLYYSRFPQLSFAMVRGTVMAAMRTFVPSTPEYSHRQLTGFHEELETGEVVEESGKTYAQIIERYEMENYFLQQIREGDVQGVLLAYENMSTSYNASASPAQWAYYTTDWSGFSVLRTLARKAAEQGGASVVKIDEITRESMQRFAFAKTEGESSRIQKQMLLRLTQAVSDAKQLAAFSPLVAKTIRDISANYSYPLSLGSLARMNHVSEAHLSRQFKKETGQTLTDFLCNLRTKKAAELLKSTRLSVSEIAMYIGYPDNNYFAKVFKRRYGMTPSAYRSLV